MKILEHTSTRMTLQDSAIDVWFVRLGGSIFLIMGCVGLFLFIESFEEIIWDNLDNIIKELLGGVGFMIFNLTLGSIFVFFVPKTTVWIDKEKGKLILNYERLLGTKIIEYSIGDITSVIVEKNYNYDAGSTYIVYLKIGSKGQKIQLSNLGFKKAQERANLIRSFLNMPL